MSGEVSFSLRSSPYPTPDDLRQYETIQPGFTDRMLSLTERETDHRIELETYQSHQLAKIARRGQALAFVVVMVLVGGGIAAVLAGQSVGGYAGIGVGAATLVGAFVAPNLFEKRSHDQGEKIREESGQQSQQAELPAPGPGEE